MCTHPFNAFSMSAQHSLVYYSNIMHASNITNHCLYTCIYSYIIIELAIMWSVIKVFKPHDQNLAITGFIIFLIYSYAHNFNDIGCPTLPLPIM